MPRAGQIFMEMKTDYHIACGNEAALEKAYEAGQRESRVFSGEQKNSDAYLRELIRLADELQRERERAGGENETIRHRANTDALCNIPNRYALNRHLEQTYERAFREKTRMGVCLLDVDGLKAYNDANGHAAGDACLMRIGEILSQAALSPGVFAARYGGDEFVLVFDNYTDREIRASIARIADAFPISVSAGMYNGIPDDKHRNWDYLARADSDLYKNNRARQL